MTFEPMIVQPMTLRPTKSVHALLARERGAMHVQYWGRYMDCLRAGGAD